MDSVSQCRGRKWPSLALKWIFLYLLIADGVCQICDQDAETLDPEVMKKHLHLTAVPRGRQEAGYFEEDVDAENIAECLVSCCEKPLCNVAWYTHKRCFTIECDENNESSCDPIPQSSASYNGTVLIQVRFLNNTKHAAECSLAKDCGDNQHCGTNSNNVRRCQCNTGFTWKSTHSKTCIEVSSTDNNGSSEDDTRKPVTNSKVCEFGVTLCGKHKKCVVAGPTSKSGICQCVAGYVEDSRGNCVVNKDCEVGVTHCGKNRECVQEGSRSKTGMCKCLKGYGEDDSGDCVAEENLATKTAESSDTPKVAISVEEKSTQMPEPQDTSTVKVEMLTVSAGENKEIQLPVNEVVLAAFALPKASEGDEYHYDWTMEAHPDAEEYGNMDGRNTNTLKLNKLIPGLYTFRVQVTGTNRFGEAQVNVTVKPPARENQAPVAVITPTNLQVKLPNSAILDGSVEMLTVSAGENKEIQLPVNEVVLAAFALPKASEGDEYHYDWTMEAHPDAEEYGNMDGRNTNTLKLNKLIPGLYTFRVQVTGTNRFGEAQVNVTVKPPARENQAPVAVITPTNLQVKLPNSAILDGSVEMLTVSAGENKEIQLPVNEVVLAAFALPKASEGDEYHYDWTMEAHPDAEEYGNMDGRNTNTLKLNKLIPGLYTFRVQVTGTNRFGEAQVNVTVKPPARENQAPVAVITPTNLQVKLPNSAILDGSDSTDDDKIVSYRWDVVSGPLQDKSITGDTAILKLTELVPGNYTLKLTVTDSDGETNATTANVTVIKETDYPPKANAGSDVVIHLPQNSVVLYGNLSTDDKGIVSYEWIKASGDKLAADMQGTRTSKLLLSHLEVGDYMFTLKVTDAAGQVSTADVHVYVKPEQNTPPIARTAGSVETSLPLDSILLDGSNSTDDQKITSFLWQQTGGPTILSIQDADQETAAATGDIKVGKYVFKLTVKDIEELTSSSVLNVVVEKVQNEAPVADAGGDVVVQLPQMLVVLDGSKSTDDHKITEYSWVREPKSLSAGNILNNSDHQAVLQLVNLVAGKYTFSLTVMDAEGLSNTDQASILVKPADHRIDLMELVLEADITQFTEENKKNLEGQLALLLPKNPSEGETVISIQSISETSASGNLRILFYAMNVMRDTRVYRSGTEALQVFKKKLLSSPYVLEFKVVSVDTFVCQNNCSNHGHCDMKSKLCICEPFWTHNIFLYWMQGESNCDWSILYVVIVCFLIVISCTGALWACVCCWQRKRCPCHRCRLRSRKRHRYSLLQDVDDVTESIALKKNKIQNSSVMISESDFSTEEEETLFVNQKKTNGHVGPLNGISKQHLKTSLKT